MAEYHVKLNDDGKIYAGTLSKTGKLTNKSDVTEEALEAVRDHLLYMTRKEQDAVCFAWKYQNGKSLLLQLEEKDSVDIKEKK